MSVMKGKVTAQWMDPSSGEKKRIQGSPFVAEGIRELTTPGKNSSGYTDWVLILTGR